MMFNSQRKIPASRRTDSGFTLIELMIAMVLGLLIVAGVGSVFIANQNAYRTNVALGEVQESARTSFEFLARDIRSAGANPCGTASVASVLKPGGDSMLYSSGGIEGWENATTAPNLPASGVGAPVAGAGDALRLAGARGAGLELESTNGQRLSVNLKSATTAIGKGDIVMICDIEKATLFQVTSDNASNKTVTHNKDDGSPGNQTECLNHPVPQSPGSTCTTFSPSSYLAIPTNYVWYIGENDAGGRSLYRYGRGQEATSGTAEMVRGVWAMEVTYHEQGGNSYVAAGSVGNWETVDAVRLELTVRSGGVQPASAMGAGTDNQPLERAFTSTVALRNRLDN
ncbi:PilW family protein [Marinobacter nanhaiticus D15-8W]|uniref:Prepilin-type N-terminal cleavage/methylation domain-containing protein n=1 Tax=Marinobacter nanhaiticus D15-8W TaxID=626887 RepID=N6VR18_9GAMM|nr:PilW family protein [Marinobacter nanhaiticus]ENO12645.2 prepilin-type N-terminal cleavage/methylation domain-containing protein [Marinobacter nanhaiticus D15-8W]BES69983.1 PilW family protein [Marinobacter nanhaiticus D15-8W]